MWGPVYNIVGLRGRVLFSQCKVIGPSVIPLSLSDKLCGTQRLDRGGPLMHRPIPKSASDENLCIMFHEKGLWLRLDYYTRWILLLVEGWSWRTYVRVYAYIYVRMPRNMSGNVIVLFGHHDDDVTS